MGIAFLIKLLYIRSMIKTWLNVNTILLIVAVIIVAGTVFYSNYLGHKIELIEKKKVELWVEAQRTILTAPDESSFNLAAKIATENTDIPIIETDEKDNIHITNCVNLDTQKIKTDSLYLYNKLAEFKKLNDPFILVISENPYQANKYYYGETVLRQEVRYYPIIQLIVAGLFIIVAIFAQRSSNKSTQNQLWAGMAKETAHQLGTPVTSLKGWVEVLKEIKDADKLAAEMEKDVIRLELITDRFGKIGSQPHLEKSNLLLQINSMVDYLKKRSGGKVIFFVTGIPDENITASISPPLFDWVIENLLKNALDAMEGKGELSILVNGAAENKIIIDITDTGKGIPYANLNKVFMPGFTTKKRGWGLGLALAKRIIEQYHKGSIYVKHSEPGAGTTFRIEIPK